MKQNRGIEALGERLRTRQIPLGWVIIAVVLILLIIVPFAWKDNSYYVHIVITIFIWGYMATAWGLVGQSGQLSFGHAAFMGIGAYTTGILYSQFGVTPWLGVFVAIGLATLGGVIIGIPTLRLRGVYFALATFAFGFIILMIVKNATYIGPVYIGGGAFLTLPRAGQAPAVFQFESKTPYYFMALAMLAGIVYLSHWFNRSRMGFYWTAIRGDQDAAESLGIDAAKYRLRAFLISCALTGLGGAFFMQYFRFFSPQKVLDVSQSIQIALIGIVGGWQSVFGPMIGGFIIVPVAELLRLNLGAFPAMSPIIYGIILMLFILFMPNGVNEPFMRGLNWLERKYWRPSQNANNENNEKVGRQ